MKAKRITALLMALTLTATLSACGGSDTGNKSSVSESKEVENDISKISSAASRSFGTATTEAVSSDEEATGEAVATVAQAEPNSEPVEPTSNSSDTGGTKEAEPKAEPKVQATSKPKPSTKAPEPAAKAPEQTAKAPEPTTKAPEPVPVHTHSWKEHTATTQTWVPNIVVVDDYDYQTVTIRYYECECGELFEGEGAKDAVREHGKTNMLEAARNNTMDSCRCGGWYFGDRYETQKVKVGSHEEDHGHYETSAYVDYYYCDCGARK